MSKLTRAGFSIGVFASVRRGEIVLADAPVFLDADDMRCSPSQRGGDLIVGTKLVDVRNGWLIWGGQFSHKASELLLIKSELSARISGRLPNLPARFLPHLPPAYAQQGGSPGLPQG